MAIFLSKFPKVRGNRNRNPNARSRRNDSTERCKVYDAICPSTPRPMIRGDRYRPRSAPISIPHRVIYRTVPYRDLSVSLAVESSERFRTNPTESNPKRIQKIEVILSFLLPSLVPWSFRASCRAKRNVNVASETLVNQWVTVAIITSNNH